MRRLLMFGLGLLARLLALIAGHYADWLFGRASEEDDRGVDLLHDLGRFFRRLVTMTARRLTGRNGDRHYDYEEEQEWQPELFGAR
jgi:hypothetical protein